MNERSSGISLEADQKKTNDGVFWAWFFHQKFRANDLELQISREGPGISLMIFDRETCFKAVLKV